MSMVSSVTGTLKVRDILHLELKRAERLDHVAEDEQQVAHTQGAQQRVEQTFHHPEGECDVNVVLMLWILMEVTFMLMSMLLSKFTD